jgi:hypothetical protein
LQQRIPKARGPTAARREDRREARRRRVETEDSSDSESCHIRTSSGLEENEMMDSEDEVQSEDEEKIEDSEEEDEEEEEDIDSEAEEDRAPGSGAKARATVAMKERERALKLASLAQAQRGLHQRKHPQPANNENAGNTSDVGVEVSGVVMTPPARAPPAGREDVTLSTGRVLSPKFLDMCGRIARFQNDFGTGSLRTLQDGTVKDYAQMLAQRGMVETSASMAELVQKVGRDKVFENVKFCTALNANLFQYKGCVMRTVCEALNISGRNVDALQWNEMFKSVRKGMANRRNSVRTGLRLEVQG